MKKRLTQLPLPGMEIPDLKTQLEIQRGVSKCDRSKDVPSTKADQQQNSGDKPGERKPPT